MPCRDGGPSYDEDMKRRLDLVTRLLCETCAAMTPTREALAWFELHKAEDARRIARESEDARRLADRLEREAQRARAAADEARARTRDPRHP